MPEPLLKMVFSMVGWWFDSPEQAQDLEDVGLPAISEIQRRGLDWPVGAYALELLPKDQQDFATDEWALDLTSLTDQSVRVWYACASEVMAYSCLERGVRQAILFLFDQTKAELLRRRIEPDFYY